MTTPEDGIETEAEARRTAQGERRGRADDRVLQQTLIAGLAASANDLAGVARDLHRASILSRTERLVLLGILLVNLVIGAVVAVGVYKLQNLAETNRANGQLIVDCTTPGGTCYDQAQQQTGAAVATLSRVVVAAVECADQLDGPAVQACITARVKAGK